MCAASTKSNNVLDMRKHVNCTCRTPFNAATKLWEKFKRNSFLSFFVGYWRRHLCMNVDFSFAIFVYHPKNRSENAFGHLVWLILIEYNERFARCKWDSLLQLYSFMRCKLNGICFCWYFLRFGWWFAAFRLLPENETSHRHFISFCMDVSGYGFWVWIAFSDLLAQ